MSIYLLPLAAVLGGVALLLHMRKSPFGARKVSRSTSIAALATITIVGLAFGFWPVLFPPERATNDSDGADGLLLDGMGAPAAPLAAGQSAPPLTAQGWVNGAPPPESAQLTVVDIWAFW